MSLPPPDDIERLLKELGLKGMLLMLPTLLTGDFVRRGDNLICFGLPGRGKSHYCAAIGRELIRQHQMKVLFTPTFRLVSHLLKSKAEHALPKYLEKLHRFDAIIIDSC